MCGKDPESPCEMYQNSEMGGLRQEVIQEMMMTEVSDLYTVIIISSEKNMYDRKEKQYLSF